MIRASLAALALLAAPALADEVWDTAQGQVIYVEDIRDIAVLSFPVAAPPFAQAGGVADANLYVPGLGGNFDARSVHDGYWAMPGQPICSAALTAPDGMTTQAWGRARIVFDRPGFPTGFTLLLGACFDEPLLPLRAVPN